MMNTGGSTEAHGPDTVSKTVKGKNYYPSLTSDFTCVPWHVCPFTYTYTDTQAHRHKHTYVPHTHTSLERLS